MYECCQHCCWGWSGGVVSLSGLWSYTASNWSAWLLSQKEAFSKDDTQESQQIVAEEKQYKDMSYRKHILFSDETKINLFGSDGVKRVWQQQSEEYRQMCLAYSQSWWRECHVWGCMSSVSCGVLRFIEGTNDAIIYCRVLPAV